MSLRTEHDECQFKIMKMGGMHLAFQYVSKGVEFEIETRNRTRQGQSQSQSQSQMSESESELDVTVRS